MRWYHLIFLVFLIMSCCRLQRYFCKIIFSKWIREFSQSDVCFLFFFKWILCWNDEWSRLWPFHCIHITVFNDASWFTLTDCCCCEVFMLHLPNVVYLYCCSKNALNGYKNVFCFFFVWFLRNVKWRCKCFFHITSAVSVLRCSLSPLCSLHNTVIIFVILPFYTTMDLSFSLLN